MRLCRLVKGNSASGQLALDTCGWNGTALSLLPMTGSASGPQNAVSRPLVCVERAC